jgi:hypothetical protein
MTDIVNSLRQTRANMLGTPDEQHYWDCHEAADEIELLRRMISDGEVGFEILAAQNRRLRAVLELFECDCTVEERCSVPDNCRNFLARRALEAK